MTGGEKLFITILALGGAAVTIASASGNPPVSSGGQRADRRGMGDDQYNEGLGVDLSLQLGMLQPADHTRWHYGGGMDGEPLPSNWARHRLPYPRRLGEMTEYCQGVPLNHPAFPKADAQWYYDPPGNEGL